MSFPRLDKEQELSHLLLIELLAHQFCFPVRWIETQDLVLKEQQTERIIELGPSDTLITMAKRTRDNKYKQYDTANSIKREFLSFKNDKENIYCTAPRVERSAKKPKEKAQPKAKTPAPTPTPVAEPVVASPSVAATSGPATSVPDVPITASLIVKSMVSSALNKDIDESLFGKSIKHLTGGRSTVQNEIIGNLDKEFGTLPDAPEDMELSKLSAFLQSSFNGQLGRFTKTMTDRMLASKMPGGFSLTSVRDYLKSTYGFDQGRQDAILISAVNTPPSSRLDTEEAAKQFWAAASQKYAAEQGLTLTSPGSGSGSASTSEARVDPAAINALRKDQQSLHQQILNVYAKQMDLDLNSGSAEIAKLSRELDELQDTLELWEKEHGAEYTNGIKPVFDVRKARLFDSSWNWGYQDLLILYHDLIAQRVQVNDDHVTQMRWGLINRSTDRLVSMLSHLVNKEVTKKNTEVEQWLKNLLKDCEKAVGTTPAVRDVEYTTGPTTVIGPTGAIKYVEAERIAPALLDSCVFEKITPQIPTLSVAANPDAPITIPTTTDSDTSCTSSESGSDPIEEINIEPEEYLAIETKRAGAWRKARFLTLGYLDTLRKLTSTGISFEGRNVLLTGAGKGSIGGAILQRLLSGGARVIVTTSSFSPKTARHFQDIYSRFGSKASRLMVLPFNQGSRQDVEALVDYIYSLGDNEWDLDHIIPFAAVSEHTRGIDDINSSTELAHRLMLTNTMRLLGAVKHQKESRGIDTRPAQIILPLSPNHGVFGNDGLYAESKLGLESLLEKWHSEDWADYLSVVGTTIGWTRGTALMSDNDIVSEGIEKLGVRTFSQHEMASNIIGLMTSDILEASQLEPVVADLSGGMSDVPDLKEQVVRIRREISELSADRRMISSEAKAIQSKSLQALKRQKTTPFVNRANIKFDFPHLPDYETEVLPLSDLRGMVDLESVVVVTGFAEVGPYGNARTRWEMESQGQFSLEGCIEMAWIMGYIEHRTIPSKSYSGWVESASGEPIKDMDVKAKFESKILEHTGIRLIEARTLDGSEPKVKQFLHEIVIQDDFAPFEASKEVALDFQREHGENVRITQIAGSDQYQCQFKKGTSVLIPKALQVDCIVGGQIPTGWSAEKYGISADIISQVDPATLYALVCTVEALLSAGITDPYEFYKYIHVSDLGIAVGSGLGGITSLQHMFKERYLDQSVQKDVLAESFINTGSAWINMLLMSSSGPNITPVGACATAIESMSIGYDLISSGKAKTVLVGGYDFISKDVASEFSNMKATIDAKTDLAAGREPREMSRPTTTSRKGFVESEGCGIQVLTNAKLALEMGLPIHGIVALAETAFDKYGKSLPAPGRGILTMSRETKSTFDPPLMNMTYRKRCIAMRMQQAKEVEETELAYLKAEIESFQSSDVDFDIPEYEKHRIETIRAESQRQVKETLKMYGSDFWRSDNRIAPIRGALATWGLNIDDLAVASFHGTSTVKNDLNESEVIQSQLTHLGRKEGNPVLGVFQKHLTGHPKGAAGAWMFNGCLQIMESGIVPGNRNADNIDADLEKFDHIVYPNKNIQPAEGVKAFSVTSFGFGQKGAQAIGIHPKYLFAAVEKEVYEGYSEKVKQRQRKAYQYFHEGLLNQTLFKAKDKAPYTKEMETEYLTNPGMRLPMDS